MDALLIEGSKVTLFGFSELSEDELLRVRLYEKMMVITTVENLAKEMLEGEWQYFDGIKDPKFKAMLLNEFRHCQNNLVVFVEIAGVYYHNIILGSVTSDQVIDRYESKGIDILRREI
ncbi:MAG: hypothetical protein IKN17_10870 [Ruminococcus sp.]|nr:hypothetical protein [Ruminococcus sp.]